MTLARTIAAALVGATLATAGIGSAAADKLDDISETSPPFSSRENGKVIGYDVDLAAQVAKRLGVGMEFVPVINSERIPALQQNRIDLADSGIKAVKQMAEKKLALVRGASVDAELKAAVPSMEIVHYDTYALCFDALRDRNVAGFLADEVLLWAYAQKSGAPQDYMMIPDYELPRTAGFGIKKDEPRFSRFVDDVLLDLEKSGEAERIFNAWFAPAKRPFTFKPD